MIALLRSMESMLQQCSCPGQEFSPVQDAMSVDLMTLFRTVFIGDVGGKPPTVPVLEDAQVDQFVSTFVKDDTLASLDRLSRSRTLWQASMACDVAYVACAVLAREAHARFVTVTEVDDARARAMQHAWERLCAIFINVLDATTACAHGWLYAMPGTVDKRAWETAFSNAETCMRYLLLACEHDAVLATTADLAPPSLAFWMGWVEQHGHSPPVVMVSVQLAGRIIDGIPEHKSRAFLEEHCDAALMRRLYSG